MFFRKYKTFIRWQYCKIGCSLFLAALLFTLLPSIVRLNPEIFTVNVQMVYMSSPIALFCFSLVIIATGNRQHLKEEKRPPSHHPVWDGLRRLNATTKISVRLHEENIFGVIGLGVLKLHRIVLYIPQRGSRHKRNYSKRNFSRLLPSLAHELGHAKHWKLISFLRLLMSALEIPCYGLACYYAGSVLRSLVYEYNFDAINLALLKQFSVAILVASGGMYVRVLLRICERSFEYVADSEIYKMLGQRGVNDFAEDLSNIMRSAKTDRSIFRFLDWPFHTHPSTSARIRALKLPN